jgi:hypothetical protein
MSITVISKFLNIHLNQIQLKDITANLVLAGVLFCAYLGIVPISRFLVFVLCIFNLFRFYLSRQMVVCITAETDGDESITLPKL